MVSAKYIIGGLIAISIGVALWYKGLGNPFDDLALLRHAQVTHGQIIDISEDIESGDYGDDRTTSKATYIFQTETGQRLESTTPDYPSHAGADVPSLPMPVEIEYLPSKPSLSRIKGTGSQSIPEWVLRTFLSLAMLCLFSSIGVMMFVHGVQQARVYVRDARRNALTEWVSQIEHLDAITPAYEIRWLYEDGLALQKRFGRKRNERLDRMVGLLERAIEMKTGEKQQIRKA